MSKPSAKVLIVDDNEDIRFMIREMLDQKGSYSFLEASDGVEALSTVKNEQVDFMLCDITMPRLDGLELIEKLRSDGYYIPVILMTGNATKDKAISAIRLGVADFIEKPLGFRDLCRSVEDIEMQILSSDSETFAEDGKDVTVRMAEYINQMAKSVSMLSGATFLETHLNVLIKGSRDLLHALPDDAPAEIRAMVEVKGELVSCLRISPRLLTEIHIAALDEAHRYLVGFVSQKEFKDEGCSQLFLHLKELRDQVQAQISYSEEG